MDPNPTPTPTPTPSKLHLKKKIRKAARVLRDPGTTSSCNWKSPYSFSTPSPSKFIPKNVYLHNWDKPKPKPIPTVDVDVDVDDDSLSDARNDSTTTTSNRNRKNVRNDMNLIPRIPRRTSRLRSHHHFYSEQEDEDDDAEEVIALTLPVKTNRHSINTNSIINRKDSSSSYTYTPALSTSSYTNYAAAHRNPTTVASWDATTTSLNDDDLDLDDPLDHLPGGQGCGIPCYWSRSTRTPRLNRHRRRLRLRDDTSDRGGGRSCSSTYTPSASASPSLSVSDTLRRKGTTMLCGSQSVYAAHRRSSKFSRRRLASRTAQGVLPLLADIEHQPLSAGSDDDDLSTNFGELDLEALSRLDGRRWSNCRRSNEADDIDAMPGSTRTLSHKYRPLFFDQVVGQNIVSQSLVNAISRGRIAPVYLFQGPRGTGKTSTARVFAAALNCLSTEDTVTKPCGFCKECTDFFSGKSKDLWEVDATNKKGLDRVRYLIKNLSARPPVPSPSSFSPYKIFIIDECHLLPSMTWLTFLKFIEDLPRRVVFIFTTTDLDNVPRTVQSRCQKYLFNKIKDSDVVARLRSIASAENLDIEPDALDLIALNADGSLQDAESMLDQLGLLGKRITTSLVNELVGVVSDEKLLDLLELAMSSDTAETVKRARELMDSGVDPLVLMSQLASLIMDIIAGTYKMVRSSFKSSRSFLEGRALSEAEVDRLKHALKLLSEAEKQLRISSERSTWFTATLLQLGSVPSPEVSLSTSSRRQSSKTTDEAPSSASRGCQGITSSQIEDVSSNSKALRGENLNSCSLATSRDGIVRGSVFKFINSEELNSIWAQCIQRCHSKTLRQLLHAHGKLISISEAEGILVVYIAFVNKDIKSRAERFFISIRNSVEVVLRRNVEVRIILLPDCEDLLKNPTEQLNLSQKVNALALQKLSSEYADEDAHQEPVKMSRESFDHVEGIAGVGTVDDSRNSPLLDGSQQLPASLSGSMAENQKVTIERRQELPMHRIESIIQEQRLETAWLQAAEKGTPQSLSRLKPDKNQVLPQDGISDHHHLESGNSTVFSSQNWEDELHCEPRVLKIADGRVSQKDVIGKTHYPMSPSLLHNSNFMGNSNKDNLIYESGSGTEGCGAVFCWNRPRRREKRQRAAIRACRSRRSILFGNCAKPKSERWRGQSL